MNKILVLNTDGSPVTVMTFERGFRLVYIGKADVVSHVVGDPIVCNLSEDSYKTIMKESPTLLTSDNKLKRPTIVKLNEYIYIPHKKVTLTRQNLYRRDEYSCVYCGSKEDLTIDHVIPKSKGGLNTWENMVTCCSSCNTRKDDKPLDVFLEESGLTIRHIPYRPSYMEFLSQHRHILDDWKPYVYV